MYPAFERNTFLSGRINLLYPASKQNPKSCFLQIWNLFLLFYSLISNHVVILLQLILFSSCLHENMLHFCVSRLSIGYIQTKQQNFIVFKCIFDQQWQLKMMRDVLFFKTLSGVWNLNSSLSYWNVIMKTSWRRAFLKVLQSILELLHFFRYRH